MIFAIIIIFLILLISFWAINKNSNFILGRKNEYTKITFTPKNLDIPYKEISFKTQDNLTLKGWFISAPKESEKTIICLHGWGMNKGEVLQRTAFLREENYNLFYFDFRGSGESENGLTSIGCVETDDIFSALKFLAKNYLKETKILGLYGISMGASIALYTATHKNIFKAIILEGCYYSYNKVVRRWAWAHKKVFYFPFVLMVLKKIEKILGKKPEEFSPKYNIKDLNIPVFFITGQNDYLAKIKDANKLYNLSKEPKQLWLIEGAEHITGFEVAPQEYKTKIKTFFNKYL